MDAAEMASQLMRIELTVHVHHHFEAPLQLQQVPYYAPAVASRVKLTTKEAPVPGIITVDTTNETVALEFTDHTGEVTPNQPAGFGSVAFSTDNPSVATIATDPSNPLQGDITPVGAGTVNVSAQVLDSSGNPLTETDASGNSTSFPQPDPVALTVDPGAATGDRLALSQ